MRAEIREYVADMLQMLAPNVYKSRGYTVVGAKLPFLNVYIPSETSETMTIGPARRLQRNDRLHVEYACEDTADVVEDLIDEKASEIEALMFADPKLGGLITRLDLTNTESTVTVADGSAKPLGYIQLVFDIQYQTVAGA